VELEHGLLRNNPELAQLVEHRPNSPSWSSIERMRT
jgi:hypothetical protein